LNYWVYRDGRPQGPYSHQQVLDQAQPDTFVSAGNNWVIFAEHPDFLKLSSHPQATPQVPNPNGKAQPQTRWISRLSKVHRKAIVLGFFLVVCFFAIAFGIRQGFSTLEYKRDIKSVEKLLARKATKEDMTRAVAAGKMWANDPHFRFLAACLDLQYGDPPFEASSEILLGKHLDISSSRRINAILDERTRAIPDPASTIPGDITKYQNVVLQLQSIESFREKILGAPSESTDTRIANLLLESIKGVITTANTFRQRNEISRASTFLRDQDLKLQALISDSFLERRGPLFQKEYNKLMSSMVTVEEGTVTICPNCGEVLSRSISNVIIPYKKVSLHKTRIRSKLCEICNWETNRRQIYLDFREKHKEYLKQHPSGRYVISSGYGIDSIDLITEMARMIPKDLLVPMREFYTSLHGLTGEGSEKVAQNLTAMLGKYLILPFGQYEIQLGPAYPETGKKEFLVFGQVRYQGYPLYTNFQCYSSTSVRGYTLFAIIGRLVAFNTSENRLGESIVVPVLNIEMLAASVPYRSDPPGEVILNLPEK